MRKRIFIIFFIVNFLILFLLYGPYSGFRTLLITTSMTTMNHRYIAEFFFNDKIINSVMSKNSVIESENSNPDLVYMEDDNSFSYYDKKILSRNKEDKYKLIKIKGRGYRGYLVAIYDPSLVFVATSRYLGKSGENILTVSKNNNSIVTINAGGFYDPNWSSNGSIPHGTVISKGKVVSDYEDANVDGGFIGFNYDNKLVLGKWSKEEALKNNLRDAVEFGPFLIVNGKKTIVNGNGGYGIAPRTAIGQRKDGIVLFLVIDGRSVTSIGASINDLIEIMYKYGAYNAANLDGGSSTELVINGKVVNRPVAGGNKGLRKMPTFFIVKDVN